MTKVFIDGSYGTTGLRIHQRLQSRRDLELISIPYEERHSESARRKAYEEADFCFYVPAGCRRQRSGANG